MPPSRAQAVRGQARAADAAAQRRQSSTRSVRLSHGRPRTLFTSSPSRSRRPSSFEICPASVNPRPARATSRLLGPLAPAPRRMTADSTRAVRYVRRTRSTLQRITGPARSTVTAGAPPRAAGQRRGPALLAPRSRRAEVGQHHHPHQLALKVRQRPSAHRAAAARTRSRTPRRRDPPPSATSTPPPARPPGGPRPAPRPAA